MKDFEEGGKTADWPGFCVPVRRAPGYRLWEAGSLLGAGNYGYSWSCTPVTGGVTVRYLDFYMPELRHSYAHNRGHGFQLRCLSE